MKTNSLYLTYGILIAALGLTGFLLTHAKSALISGLASGTILVVLSFFVEKSPVAMAAKIVNFLLIGVFGWRTFAAFTAFQAGNQAKLTPLILLSAMALISLIVFVSTLKKSN